VTLEFAFALIFLLFPSMFGIIDFSRAMYAYHWVAYAAREGTRWASVRGADCVGLTGGCPAAATDIQTYVQSLHPPGLPYVASSCTTPGCLSVNTTQSFVWPGLGGDGNSCVNASSPQIYSPGCLVTVQVNYYFGFTLPFLDSLTGTTMHMQSTSQMVISQ
jgi:hypothetical protein